MWKNYQKIAWRNILKRKGYAIINITGLSVGMAACIVIIMFIVQELSYDRFHRDVEQIYRVPVKAAVAGDVFNVAVNSAPAGPGMYNDFPAITNFCRVRENSGEALITFGEKKFYEQQRLHVDSTFFQIFSFDLLQGNPDNALKRPKSVVLTKSVAEKVFGQENPIGKSIAINEEQNYLVTGVVANPPVNSHLQFKLLISLSSTENRMGSDHFTDDWGSLMYHTYVKINPNADPQTINNRLPGWYKKHIIEAMAEAEVQYQFDFNPYLQPVTSIHLHSKLFNEMSANGDIAYVYTFSAIALFILLIAGINYMNLNIAQSLKRSKEVGMRKVHGANRKQLIWQFLSESLMISLFAFIIALLLSELALPWFSQMLGYPLGMNLTEHTYLIPLLIVLMIIVGIGSGSYPAFYLSSYQPIAALKKNLNKGKKQNPLSQALVVLQFTISASLIIGAVTIYRQLDFIKNKNLGFDKEQVVVIPVRNNDNRETFERFKKELGNLSAVTSVAAVSNVPGQPLSGNGFTLEDDPSKEQRIIYTITTDEDFAKTLNMQLVEGRFFSKKFGTDSAAAVINQYAAKKFGWEQPIGKKITDYNADPPIQRKVIGVVNDFHFSSMREPIEQLIIRPNLDPYNFLVVRMANGDIKSHLQQVESKWNEIEKAFPFDYFFLDESLEESYMSEQRMSDVITLFTVIALFIASIGLLGMATFNAQQRTKEMGIRKVLGARTIELVIKMVKQYSLWVVIANLIAWPLSWYFISRWLQNFAYHTTIQWWFFGFAIITTLLLAVSTVSWQAIKTANANPVDTLHYE